MSAFPSQTMYSNSIRRTVWCDVLLWCDSRLVCKRNRYTRHSWRGPVGKGRKTILSHKSNSHLQLRCISIWKLYYYHEPYGEYFASCTAKYHHIEFFCGLPCRSMNRSEVCSGSVYFSKSGWWFYTVLYATQHMWLWYVMSQPYVCPVDRAVCCTYILCGAEYKKKSCGVALDFYVYILIIIIHVTGSG